MQSCDVVVVGAGFAGLSAAEALVKAGRQVIVLEARDRVGGCSEAMLNGLGEKVDTGGQFVCDEMPLILDLIRRQNRRLITPAERGLPRALPAASVPEQAHPHTEAEIFARANEIYYDELRHVVLTPDMAEITVAGWIAQRTPDPAIRAAFVSIAECANCISAARQPLWTLIAMHRNGPREVSEMQYFVEGTMHAVAAALADGLEGHIRLSQKVSAIEQGDGGLVIQTTSGRIAAREMVLAISPIHWPEIGFDPPLPATTAKAGSAFSRGDVVKFLIRYERAFWNQRGWSGMCQWSEPSGIWFGDASHDPARPMLVGFMGGPSAAAFRARAETGRRSLVLDELARAFGPEALTPLDYLERDWGSDALALGGYSAVVTDPAARDAVAILQQGAGRISFAGTDLADAFSGYIEGAIWSGRYAAAQVLARFDGKCVSGSE